MPKRKYTDEERAAVKKAAQRAYYAANKAVYAEKGRAYRAATRDARRATAKKYRESPEGAAVIAAYAAANREKRLGWYKARNERRRGNATEIEKSAAYRAANKAKIAAYMTTYRVENKEHIVAQRKEHRATPHARAVHNARMLTQRQSLADAYVRHCIYRETGIPITEIPQPMVELKRILLAIHRLKKEATREDTE